MQWHRQRPGASQVSAIIISAAETSADLSLSRHTATSTGRRTRLPDLAGGRTDRLVVKAHKVPVQRVHDALIRGFMMIQTNLAALARTAPLPGAKDG